MWASFAVHRWERCSSDILNSGIKLDHAGSLYLKGAGGFDQLPPIQISPSQTMDEHLSGGGIGSDRDIVLIAQLGDIVQIPV